MGLSEDIVSDVVRPLAGFLIGGATGVILMVYGAGAGTSAAVEPASDAAMRALVENWRLRSAAEASSERLEAAVAEVRAVIACTATRADGREGPRPALTPAPAPPARAEPRRAVRPPPARRPPACAGRR